MQEIISIVKCTATITTPIASIFMDIGAVARNLIGILVIGLIFTVNAQMPLVLLTSSENTVASIMINP